MVDTVVSPLPPFSHEDLVNETVEGLIYTTVIGTTINIRSTDGSSDFIIGGSSNYGGCTKCMEYSSEFGHCKSEEIFEFFKSAFVEHFNKEHRDLLMKKGLPLPKKKFTKIKTSPIGEMTLHTTPINHSSWFIGQQEYSGTFTISDESIYDTATSTAQGGARVPEYETIEVNSRNLDRNERFRLGLRT